MSDSQFTTRQELSEQANHENLSEMDTQQIVALLIAERDRLTNAIEALQGPTKRRGRPSKQETVGTPLSSAAVVPPAPKKRRSWTAAQKKAHIARMKAYWAARKQAGK